MTLGSVELEGWVAALLGAAGLPRPDARRAAWVYTRATERGLGHHDLSLLPQRLGWLAEKLVRPQPQMKRLVSLPSIEVWDADHALGEVACHVAVERACQLAKKSALAYVGIRRSNHFLAADPYVEWATQRDFFAIVWSNTDAGMGLPGGERRVLGNNPVGWGAGTGESSISADLCLAESSLGSLAVLADSNSAVPPHWGIGPDGKPAQDAKTLQHGAVAPIGGAKGVALALLGEMLTGVLTGGETLDHVLPPSGLNTHSQMVLAFRLDAFAPLPTMHERIRTMRESLNRMGISRIPGDRSQKAKTRSREKGLEIPESLFDTLTQWSYRWNVSIPKRHS